MALTQVALVANTITPIIFDAPAGRIVVTFITAGTVYYTLDGTAPLIPTNDTEVTSQQNVLAGVAGQQVVIQPRLYGDHMAIPNLQLLTAGTPSITVEW